jgi:hypothetical protein
MREIAQGRIHKAFENALGEIHKKRVADYVSMPPVGRGNLPIDHSIAS